MSDFPPNDWRRAAAADLVGANNADADGAAPDDELLPFAAPHGMPVLPRYGRNGESAAPASTPAPTLEPPAQAILASAISDLPTARVSAAPPMPVAPSVSDLPTTHLPSAGGSSAPTPTPASDVSDLPTQRVKATLPPPAPAQDAPAPGVPSTPRKRSRGALLLVATMVIVLLIAVSAALLSAALRPSPATTSAVNHQTLTAATEGWANGGDCRFTASGYAVSGPSVCFYNDQDVGDGMVSVTMTRASGGNDPSAGLAFRRTGPGAFYTFEIDGNGDWVVYKRGTVLQQGDNDAIKTDASAKNTLQVQMKGAHFTFFVNGAQVAQADDAEFTTGKVGLTGYTGLAVVYTDFTIAPL